MTGVVLENSADKTTNTLPVDGVFVAIGYEPINELAKKLGVVSDEEGYIVVDKGHRTNMKGLRQVLVNLVGNAIKFTERGEVVVQVEKEAEVGGEVVLGFVVADSGVGIPRDKQQLIFEAFAQADGSTTREYGGTGLGLSIAAQLVDLMGGRIGVESEPGRGSRFRFSARFGTATERARITDRLPAQLRGLRVLVVDDNATNRRILEEVLTQWRMQPTPVASARAALAAMEAAQRAGVERLQTFESRWKLGGLFFLGGFVDVLLDAKANEFAAEFVREKIRATVKDPKLASLLSPTSTIGCKRLCADSGYFETFNRPKVSLVDVNAAPIEAITATGLRTKHAQYELDSLIFATGFTP